VTRLRQVEQTALERNLLETQKLESLGVLAGGIAHDFNNLLTGVLGNAGLARLACPTNSPIRYHLDQIETTALRAAELCKQMLAYAGKGRFVVRQVDLNEVVRENAELLRTSVSRKAQLTFDLAPELPAVLADTAQMRQVVLNLVTNASEALGEQGGQVRVATGTARLVRDTLRTEKLAADLPEGEYTTLEVSDNGPGMPPEVRARVFEPFFTTKFAGRGLGLAAVLGIVRGHRGAIRVESEPGLGSTFRIFLPRSPAPAAGPAAGTEAPPAASRPAWRGEGTVLLVDDEEAPRSAAAWMLKSFGFQVVQACDGLEALEQFHRRAEAFRLVLLDVTMPRLGGQETLRELRRLRPDLPVVLMSGYSEADVREHFAGERPAGFLPKPFRMDDLMDLLRRVLPT
jgi:nitrogen-specific signal transduction histidine kinase/CheY-like chemotaxis protein